MNVGEELLGGNGVSLANARRASELAQVMTEPMRLTILTALSDDQQLSAKDFHDMLDAGKIDLGGRNLEITGVSYHFRVLEGFGAVELVQIVPVRGASKKIVKATAVGKQLCLVWAELLRIAGGDAR